MNSQMNPFSKDKSEDKLVWPRNLPYKDCSNYFLSQAITRKKVPIPDVRLESPLETLVMYSKMLDDSNTKLATKRREYIAIRKNLDEQWIDIEEKEKLLQESFVKFNKFVVENTIKSERSAANYWPNKLAAENRAIEVEKMEKTLERIKNTIERVNYLIRTHSFYEEFLASIVTRYPAMFRNIANVIDKYMVFSFQKIELNRKEQQLIDKLEEKRNRLEAMKERYETTIIRLKSTLGLLELKYEIVRVKSLQLEHDMHTLKATILEYDEMVSRTKLGIWQLYLVICVTVKEKPKISPTNLENVLVFIKKHIGRIKIIRNQTAKQTKSRTRMSFF